MSYGVVCHDPISDEDNAIGNNRPLYPEESIILKLVQHEIDVNFDHDLLAIQQISTKFSKSFSSEKENAENLADEAKLNPILKQFIRFIFAVGDDHDVLRHLKNAVDD